MLGDEQTSSAALASRTTRRRARARRLSKPPPPNAARTALLVVLAAVVLAGGKCSSSTMPPPPPPPAATCGGVARPLIPNGASAAEMIPPPPPPLGVGVPPPPAAAREDLSRPRPPPDAASSSDFGSDLERPPAVVDDDEAGRAPPPPASRTLRDDDDHGSKENEVLDPPNVGDERETAAPEEEVLTPMDEPPRQRPPPPPRLDAQGGWGPPPLQRKDQQRQQGQGLPPPPQQEGGRETIFQTPERGRPLEPLGGESGWQGQQPQQQQQQPQGQWQGQPPPQQWGGQPSPQRQQQQQQFSQQQQQAQQPPSQLVPHRAPPPRPSGAAAAGAATQKLSGLFNRATSDPRVKGLFTKIGRGLDELSGLDDKVAEGARRVRERVSGGVSGGGPGGAGAGPRQGAPGGRTGGGPPPRQRGPPPGQGRGGVPRPGDEWGPRQEAVAEAARLRARAREKRAGGAAGGAQMTMEQLMARNAGSQAGQQQAAGGGGVAVARMPTAGGVAEGAERDDKSVGVRPPGSSNGAQRQQEGASPFDAAAATTANGGEDAAPEAEEGADAALAQQGAAVAGGAEGIEASIAQQQAGSQRRPPQRSARPGLPSRPGATPPQRMGGTPPPGFPGRGGPAAAAANPWADAARAQGGPQRGQHRRRAAAAKPHDDEDDDWPSPTNSGSSLGGKIAGAFKALPNPKAMLRLPSRGFVSKVFGGFGDDGSSYVSVSNIGSGSGGDDGWSDDEEESGRPKRGMGRAGGRAKKTSAAAAAAAAVRRRGGRGGNGAIAGVPRPVADLLGRSARSSSGAACPNLLSETETRACRRSGRTRAVLDLTSLAFALLAAREVLPYLDRAEGLSSLPRTLEQCSAFLSALVSPLSSALLESWAPFALAASYLASRSGSIFLSPGTTRTAAGAAAAVESRAAYAQLYLRLTTGLPAKRGVPTAVGETAAGQARGHVDAVRLSTFVTAVLTALIAATVSVIKPIAEEVFEGILAVGGVEAWRTWPPVWGDLGSGLGDAMSPHGKKIWTLLRGEWSKVADHPMGVVVQASLFAVMVGATSILPALVRRGVGTAQARATDDDEDDESMALASCVSDLGISGATRLPLQAQAGAVERVLERWSVMRPRSPAVAAANAGLSRTDMAVALQRLGFALLGAVLLAVPLLLHLFVVPPTVAEGTAAAASPAACRLGTALSLSVVLLHANGLLCRALSGAAAETSRSSAQASAFLSTLQSSVRELAQLRASPQADPQLSATASPARGLDVADLWSAHVSRRAWALQGVNLKCRSGEVTLILGDEGSGRSRLLTALGENLLQPPRRSRTTTHVRGTVSLGGVDGPKWDRSQLKRRVGVVLNDVRTRADTAGLLSGCTLEEILEPGGCTDMQRGRAAVTSAMQITGLTQSLLPRLPSKMSTVLTANEEDLTPSPLRPPAFPLGPSDWSKVLLTRALAQTIAENDNPMSSPDSVLRSMVGSLLLLDDATSLLSEVEEAELIKALRSTGAAVVLTSNRWSGGRFASRIAVMREGSVVESGTHGELLSLGPQGSAYASKWSEMTSA